MPKKRILCFDGTWSRPDDERKAADRQVETNARRFYEALIEGPAVPDQTRWYDDGVGTAACWFEKIAGGAFGLGLDMKIQDGYRYLVENYEPGDRLYLVGYSRGAYSARSLLGMLRKCGLLHREYAAKVPETYALYRKRHGTCDCRETIGFRERWCKEMPIHFVGVFDTVGSLGIPLPSFSAFNMEQYRFHDVELADNVEHAYHAMALDEHRDVFNVSLWDPTMPTAADLEQRWFPGSHSDIGGGVGDRRLSDLPLRWMIERGLDCGLIFDPRQVPMRLDRNHRAPVFDSYADFLDGAFSLVARRLFRPVGRTYFGNEVLDDSVLRRLDEDSEYRPLNQGVLVG